MLHRFFAVVVAAGLLLAMPAGSVTHDGDLVPRAAAPAAGAARVQALYGDGEGAGH